MPQLHFMSTALLTSLSKAYRSLRWLSPSYRSLRVPSSSKWDIAGQSQSKEGSLCEISNPSNPSYPSTNHTTTPEYGGEAKSTIEFYASDSWHGHWSRHPHMTLLLEWQTASLAGVLAHPFTVLICQSCLPQPSYVTTRINDTCLTNENTSTKSRQISGASWR